VKLFEDFKPLALATAALLVFVVTAGALMWFGFFCGCRYAEEKTMAVVYKAQLDRTQELMRSDLAIVNGYKEGQHKAHK
jgi:hypothetical protein